MKKLLQRYSYLIEELNYYKLIYKRLIRPNYNFNLKI